MSSWNIFQQKQEENADTNFKKGVALESTIALCKQNKLTKILNVLLKLVWYLKYATAA